MLWVEAVPIHGLSQQMASMVMISGSGFPQDEALLATVLADLARMS